MTNNQAEIMTDIKAHSWNEMVWTELTERLSLFLSLSKEQSVKLKESRLAELIGAIPFLAGCTEPEKQAMTHLLTTFLASHKAGKDLFSHNFSHNYSLQKRLEPISHFEGGNREILKRGMDLLAVIMLSDHKKDSFMDRRKGKYNPLNAGIWNYDAEIARLEDSIKSVECPSMDGIISFEEAKAYWWEFL
jgi:hypothetical protein